MPIIRAWNQDISEAFYPNGFYFVLILNLPLEYDLYHLHSCKPFNSLVHCMVAVAVTMIIIIIIIIIIIKFISLKLTLL